MQGSSSIAICCKSVVLFIWWLSSASGEINEIDKERSDIRETNQIEEPDYDYPLGENESAEYLENSSIEEYLPKVSHSIRPTDLPLQWGKNSENEDYLEYKSLQEKRYVKPLRWGKRSENQIRFGGKRVKPLRWGKRGRVTPLRWGKRMDEETENNGWLRLMRSNKRRVLGAPLRWGR
ncbi:hypothetical protein QYM36_003868 [Artemia franciscana]|uniref:Uncharacterized protein n=1 Tax=Artemia franciscana TaxID=6661 RepID=A0AA88I4K2_ARTSF|nr:hypothetical protein QYM36_003868 [Artemia franciscana]